MGAWFLEGLEMLPQFWLTLVVGLPLLALWTLTFWMAGALGDRGWLHHLGRLGEANDNDGSRN